MKIYIDIILLINFFFDFILLFSVSKILRRNTKLIRLFFGAIVGSISIITLFITITQLILFIYKIMVSIIMVLICFGYKSIKYFVYNLVYLYINSILLGGFLYFINNIFSYKNIGLIFINNGYSINIIIIFVSAPIISLLYVIQQRKTKEDYSKCYEVDITFLNGKKTHLQGFLDTGNNLYDPYTNSPIIVLNKFILKDYKPRCVLVPIYTINNKSFMKCFKVKKIVINNHIINKKCLIGISDNNFNLDGIDLLLHKKIIKEIKND